MTVKFYNPIGFSDQEQRAHRLLWLICGSVIFFVVWSYFGRLDEVVVGEGKVVTSLRTQTVQSLEGGIIAKITVKEGDSVKKGDVLAELDPAIATANVGETLAKLSALKAQAARLDAQVQNRSSIDFPKEVHKSDLIIQRETELFTSAMLRKNDALNDMKSQLELVLSEQAILNPLLKSGATNRLEIIRVNQKIAELSGKIKAIENEFQQTSRQKFNDTMAEIDSLEMVRKLRGRYLERTQIYAPIDGIVGNMFVSTSSGSVVSQNGRILDIVPTDDQLLIETKINPRDIAFIHDDQKAVVKITAYDSSIYGDLNAVVERISPDTKEDEQRRGTFFYTVLVKSDRAFLTTKSGKKLPIIPGMISNTEIRTGSRTVFEYLVKPLNKAKEALRER
jgi:membrane fusion protein, adhesin transport system